MTTCDRCGCWFDWNLTRSSEEFEEAVPIAKRLGFRYICLNCMIALIESEKVEEPKFFFDENGNPWDRDPNSY